MENSLYEGDRIIVNKWSYGLRVPLMSLFSYHRWCERPVGQQDIVVFNNPVSSRQTVIDRREVYISRCIGTPGDTLLVDSLFNVSAPQELFNPDKKRLYSYPASQEKTLQSMMKALSIDDEGLMGNNDSIHIRSFSRYEVYLLNQSIHNGQSWIHPLAKEQNSELKPLIVPGKGRVVRVYPWNITLLCNTLVLHEGRNATIKNNTLYIDGKPTHHCTFTKNYYWMSANNSANLADSRLFGFVPEDHIIGKATFVWFSKEKNTGIFDGYRWERFFETIK